MRMVRWMCGIKLKVRFPSKELRERLGIDDIALVLQQNRLRWYQWHRHGVDMSTPLLLEVAPEIDTNPTSFYRGEGYGGRSG